MTDLKRSAPPKLTAKDLAGKSEGELGELLSSKVRQAQQFSRDQLKGGLAGLRDGLLERGYKPSGKTPKTRSEAKRENLNFGEGLMYGSYNLAQASSASLADMVASIPEVVGDAGQLVGWGSKDDPNLLRRGAAAIRDSVAYDDRMLAGDHRPVVEPGLPSDIAGAFGSAVGFVGAGAALAKLGVSATLSSGVLGSLQQAQSEFRRAEQGSDNPWVHFAALLGGGVIGTSEAIGIGGHLEAMNARTGGKLRSVLMMGFHEMAEEGAQEFGQTVSSEVLAQYVLDYATDQEFEAILKNATKGGLIGALVGFGMGSGGAAMQDRYERRIAEIAEKKARKAQTDAARKALGRAGSYQRGDIEVEKPDVEVMAKRFVDASGGGDFKVTSLGDASGEKAAAARAIARAAGIPEADLGDIHLVDAGRELGSTGQAHNGVILIDINQIEDVVREVASHEFFHRAAPSGTPAGRQWAKDAQEHFPLVASILAQEYEADYVRERGERPFANVSDPVQRQALIIEEAGARAAEMMPNIISDSLNGGLNLSDEELLRNRDWFEALRDKAVAGYRALGGKRGSTTLERETARRMAPYMKELAPFMDVATPEEMRQLIMALQRVYRGATPLIVKSTEDVGIFDDPAGPQFTEDDFAPQFEEHESGASVADATGGVDEARWPGEPTDDASSGEGDGKAPAEEGITENLEERSQESKEQEERALAASRTQIDKDFGVGKVVGASVYMERDAAMDVLPDDAQEVIREFEADHASDFEVKVVRYNKKTGEIMVAQVFDFDSASEPALDATFTYRKGKGWGPRRSSTMVYHHKWAFVRPDYAGFDRDESMAWSEKWTAEADAAGVKRASLGRSKSWQEFLKDRNLVRPGDSTETPDWLSGEAEVIEKPKEVPVSEMTTRQLLDMPVPEDAGKARELKEALVKRSEADSADAYREFARKENELAARDDATAAEWEEVQVAQRAWALSDKQRQEAVNKAHGIEADDAAEEGGDETPFSEAVGENAPRVTVAEMPRTAPDMFGETEERTLERAEVGGDRAEQHAMFQEDTGAKGQSSLLDPEHQAGPDDTAPTPSAKPSPENTTWQEVVAADEANIRETDPDFIGHRLFKARQDKIRKLWKRLAKNPWQTHDAYMPTSANDKTGERSTRNTRLLEDLADQGLVQRRYDAEGTPHYAPNGVESPADLSSVEVFRSGFEAATKGMPEEAGEYTGELGKLLPASQAPRPVGDENIYFISSGEKGGFYTLKVTLNVPGYQGVYEPRDYYVRILGRSWDGAVKKALKYARGKNVYGTKFDLNGIEKQGAGLLKFGRWRGRSIVEVAEKDPGYIDWLFTSGTIFGKKNSLILKEARRAGIRPSPEAQALLNADADALELSHEHGVRYEWLEEGLSTPEEFHRWLDETEELRKKLSQAQYDAKGAYIKALQARKRGDLPQWNPFGEESVAPPKPPKPPKQPVKARRVVAEATHRANQVLDRWPSITPDATPDLHMALMDALGFDVEAGSYSDQAALEEAEMLGIPAESLTELVSVLEGSGSGGTLEDIAARVAQHALDESGALKYVVLDKKVHGEAIDAWHRRHHKRKSLNKRYQHAVAVVSGGRVVAVATIGTPTGRWSGTKPIELQRVISDGSTKNASSAAAAAAISYAKAQGKTLVTYSELEEAGSTYLALKSERKDGYHMRPTKILRARKGRTGEAEPAKVRWMAGPDAGPAIDLDAESPSARTARRRDAARKAHRAKFQAVRDDPSATFVQWLRAMGGVTDEFGDLAQFSSKENREMLRGGNVFGLPHAIQKKGKGVSPDILVREMIDQGWFPGGALQDADSFEEQIYEKNANPIDTIREFIERNPTRDGVEDEAATEEMSDADRQYYDALEGLMADGLTREEAEAEIESWYETPDDTSSDWDETPFAVKRRLWNQDDDARNQEYHSEKTSRRIVPSGFRRIPWRKGQVNFDLGGGKYDEATNFLKEKGVTNLVYDPFNRTRMHNMASVGRASRGVDSVTVMNVLNVVKEQSQRHRILRQAASLVRAGGVVRIQVYEGSKEQQAGGPTATKDGWQEFRKTESYLPEVAAVFNNVVRKGKLIEASDPIELVSDDPMFAIKRKSRYSDLSKSEKARVDSALEDMPNGAKVRKLLDKHAGTPWAREAIRQAQVREGLKALLSGKRPAFRSAWDSKTGKKMADAILGGGEEAIWLRLSLAGTSIISTPSKPVNSVSSSYLNCTPSSECASSCYATNGQGYDPTVLKAELVEWAVKTDPQRAAEITATHYKSMPEFHAKKALRLFDRGDGGMHWVPYVEALNAAGIRAQVFSKDAAFLRALPEMNLRMYSVDGSNLRSASQVKDLPVAFVYTGAPKELAWLSKNLDRVQVVLPIKLGSKLLNDQAQTRLKAVKGIMPKVCPVDRGTVKIGKNPLGRAKDNWNCTRCDDGGGSVGCFYKSPTSEVLKQTRSLSDSVSHIGTEVLLDELKARFRSFPEADQRRLGEELALLLRQAQSGADPETEGGFDPRSAARAVEESDGRGEVRGDGQEGLSSVTRSPEFRAWFGDSKVVDEAGRPLVVYHGTMADFTEFRGASRSGLDPYAFFASDPDIAGLYASHNGRQRDGVGGRMLPVYLSIQNPLEVMDTGVAAGGIPELLDRPENAAYDGAIVRSHEDGSVRVAITRAPTQIKSASGNSGAFDASDPDIRHSVRRSIEREGELYTKLRGLVDMSYEIGDYDRAERWDAVLDELLERADARYSDLDESDVLDEYEGEPNLGEADSGDAVSAIIEAHRSMSTKSFYTDEDRAGNIRETLRIALYRQGIDPKGVAAIDSLSDQDLIELGRELTVERDAMIERIKQPADPRWAVKAHHGGLASFGKFSTDYVGEGEGNQAYGWGLYFADKKGVAEHYKEALPKKHAVTYTIGGKPASPREYSTAAMDDVIQANNDRALAIFYHRRYIEWLHSRGTTEEAAWGPGFNLKVHNTRVRQIEDLPPGEISRSESTGHGYTVELAPDDDEYLLWDRPLSEQSSRAQSALTHSALGLEPRTVDGLWRMVTPSGVRLGTLQRGGTAESFIERWDQGLNERAQESGSRAYRWLTNGYAVRDAKAASLALRDAGIRGIKYLDGTSRSKGEGSYNYVIFDDADIDIVDRWAVRRNTDSDRFRSWFGNSVVVDEHGAPRVMYHGTVFSWLDWEGNETPHEPNPRHDGATGLHVGTRTQSSTFSVNPYFPIDSYDHGPARAYPLYVSIQNPVRLTDHGGWTLNDWVRSDLVRRRITSQEVADVAAETQFDPDGQGFVEILQALGYDGVEYLNRYEMGIPRKEVYERLNVNNMYAAEEITHRLSDREFLSLFPEAEISYIVFEPSQVKSAIGNNGAFNPNDPDLRHAVRRGGQQPGQGSLEGMGVNDDERAGGSERVRTHKSYFKGSDSSHPGQEDYLPPFQSTVDGDDVAGDQEMLFQDPDFKKVDAEGSGIATAGAELFEEWISNRQVSEEWAKSRAAMRERQLRELMGRRDVRTVIGEAFAGDSFRELRDMELAMHLYIDLGDEAQQEFDRWGADLTAEQKRIFELSQNLPPAIRAMADDIQRENHERGRELEKRGLIREAIENYTARVWEPFEEGDVVAGNAKFSPTSPRFKARGYSSILQGWALGRELAVESAISAQQMSRIQTAQAIHDMHLREFGLKAGVLSTVQREGDVELTHPNFRRWVHAGTAVPGRVYGKDVRVTDDGMLLRRSAIYAQPELARMLNNATGSGWDNAALDLALKVNAHIKSTILFTSLFHHQAFLRSYLFGTPMVDGKKNLNPAAAYGMGREAIEKWSPELEYLVKHGLTLDAARDIDEMLLQDKTAIGKVIDKVAPLGAAKNALIALRDQQTNFLFHRLGPYFKAQAAILEFRHLLHKHKEELKTGEVSMELLAKQSAKIANEDFGGLNLQRKGRNPHTQQMMRLLLLAPDWTESNVLTMLKFFRRGQGGQVYRDMWKRVVARAGLLTVLGNLLMAGWDDDEEDPRGGSFAKRTSSAWKEGKLRILDMDITPLARAIGGSRDQRYYFSVLGHFRDPIKFILHPILSLSHKGSPIVSMASDAWTGTDWASRPYTSASELVGLDDKGTYVKSGKRTDGSRYHSGDPKGGQLAGQTVKWGRSNGALDWSQVPSFAIAQAAGTMPIQAQNAMGYAAGEIDGFAALAKSLGFMVASTRPMSPSEHIHELKRQIEASSDAKRVRELNRELRMWERIERMRGRER